MSRTARRSIPLALAPLVLSMVLMAAIPVDAQQHGGSLLNTSNRIALIEAGAANGFGISPAKGHVIVRDVGYLENPTTSPIDYAILYVPPEFVMLTGYPKVLSYIRDYTVSNYTVVFTDSVNGTEIAVEGIDRPAIRGVMAVSYVLDKSMFVPGVNYTWRAIAVETRGFNVTTVPVGSFNSSALRGGESVIFDELGLPPIGKNHEVADTARLANITQKAYLEPHELLVEGFYRFRVQNMTFEPGINVTVELRFGGMVGDDGSVEVKELLFTERPVSIEVYQPGGLDVRLYSQVGPAEMPVSPTSSIRYAESGTLVTRFNTTTSFRLVVQPPKDEGGTDWGMVARWAVLVVAIGIIVSIILYPGRKERRGTVPIEEGEALAGSERDDDEDDDETPEGPSPDDELARLEAERDAKVREMREQYTKGERGELPKDEVERLGDRARADVKRINQRIKELKREQAR